MKICAACSRELPKAKFSKKQWQLKHCRRCKECISDNREVTSLAVSNDAPPSDNNQEMQLEAHKPQHLVNGEAPPCLADEDLFKKPQPNEECPICFVPLPSDCAEQTYHECCGKTICNGCTCAGAVDVTMLCPFCRTPAPTSNRELIKRMKKRAKGGDADAICELGCYYADGDHGTPQNYEKAVELLLSDSCSPLSPLAPRCLCSVTHIDSSNKFLLAEYLGLCGDNR